MKKQHFIVIILSFCILAFLSSCKRERIPDGVMDTATMAAFLTEAYVIESYNSIIISRTPDSLGYILNAAYDSLYAKYGITPTDYDSSMAYYIRQPKILEEINKRVTENLRKKKE